MVAVPEGMLVLDKASLATKAHTKAKIFNATKPAKYTIKFYALVGNEGPYLFSMQDNKRGNTAIKANSLDYIRHFPCLSRPFSKHIHNDIDITPGMLSALWTLMLAHSTQKSFDPSGTRYYFMDNYYTRHNLAGVVKSLTDGESRIIGTVKYTNIDTTDRVCVSHAMNVMKEAERGEWVLVPTYNNSPTLEDKKEHQRILRALPKAQRQPFHYPLDNKAEKVGYIIWKDSKLVVFYCNCFKKHHHKTC